MGTNIEMNVRTALAASRHGVAVPSVPPIPDLPTAPYVPTALPRRNIAARRQRGNTH